MNTCGGCTATWTGQNICHCGACHQTFSTILWFDAHRSPDGPHGACKAPQAILDKDDAPQMKLNAHGVWVGNTTMPHFWEAS